MFNIDEFIGDCLVAVREPEPRLAVKDVLERALSDPAAVTSALPPSRAEIQKQHVSAELTVLTGAWAPGMAFPPHDHRMWAAIGVYTGQEDNAFYRRAPGGLLAAGGRQVCDGEVLLLGDDAIHAVANPRRSFTGSIHVYGGDLLATSRSEWDPVALEERPYDVAAAFRYFETQNAKLAHCSPTKSGTGRANKSLGGGRRHPQPSRPCRQPNRSTAADDPLRVVHSGAFVAVRSGPAHAGRRGSDGTGRSVPSKAMQASWAPLLASGRPAGNRRDGCDRSHAAPAPAVDQHPADRAVERAVALLGTALGPRHAPIVSAPEGVDTASTGGIMASLISPTSLGGGMAGGPLRCSVCGRRVTTVEHLVRARGIHICDRCVAQASEALAAASPGQKVVRMRPAPAHVGDREATEAAVEEAFETVFNAQVPIEERCRAIENGDNLGETFERARQRHPGAGTLDVSVDSVRFLSEDEAAVQFTLWLAGFGQSGMPRTGHAVRVRDGWKVARDTWCELVRMVGVECPPPE